MKRGALLFLLLFFLFSQIVFSETKSDLVMNQNDNVTVGGKNIKFLYASGTSAAFSVDGTNTIAPFNVTKFYRGVKILVKEIYGNNLVLVDLTVDQICGDNKCEQNEDCCKDCGCSQGFFCFNNQCLDSSLNKCNTDLNCNDNNNCTIDKCIGYPSSCNNEDITTCIADDSCCPGSCNETTDIDCRKCPINECFVDNQCIKESAIYNNSYCLASNLNLLKSNKEACSNNFECISGICENKLCTKESQKITSTKKETTKQPSKFNEFVKNKNNIYVLIVLILAIILLTIKFNISKKTTGKGMNW